MLYKTEDSFSNYKNVKREVPERDTFLKMIVDNVYNYCDTIEIAEPNTELAKILNETKCKIVDDNLKINSKTKQKRVISFPNEKTLLYGIMKASIDDVKEDLPTEEKAIITCIEIGKCETEASGGITRDMLKEIAGTGVTYISAGAVTHSAKNIDLSLKALKI